jgi:hypothetical protein
MPKETDKRGQWDNAKESYEYLVEKHGIVTGTIEYYKILFGMK